jgi:Glucose-6-phosphate dehydrogenase, C-terminal domain
VGVTLADSGDEMNTVIAGGVAAGASTGARLRRLDEPAEIVVLERDRCVSFANCGLPHHTGGAIPDRGSLLLQTPESPRDLRLFHTPGEQPPVGRGPACAHLIRDMLNSNPMLFIRGDEAGEAWRIIYAVMNAWTAGDVPMQQYPADQEGHAVAAPERTISGTGKVTEDRKGGR